MGDKKNIDRLFQEKLKDFEATPSDSVWKNIEAKLSNENKKSIVIPIWWRNTKIAASILLLLTLGLAYFYSKDNIIENQVGNIELKTNPIEENKLINLNESQCVSTSSNATSEGLNKSKEHISEIKTKSNTLNKSLISTTNTLPNKNSINNNSDSKLEQMSFSSSLKAKTEVVSRSKSNIEKESFHNKKDELLAKHSETEKFSNSVSKNTEIAKSNIEDIELDSPNALANNKQQITQEGQNITSNGLSDIKESQIVVSQNTNNAGEVSNNNLTSDGQYKTIEIAPKPSGDTNVNKIVANKEKEVLVKDGHENKSFNSKQDKNRITKKNMLNKEFEKNTYVVDEKKDKSKSQSIEEAISKTKNVIEEDKKDLNRWSVAPNAAPVYFNTLGSGSSMDSKFNSNSKTSERNMSYGISASYALNKKLSIRSGINKVNLGYNTNGVILFQPNDVSANDSNPNAVNLGSIENVVSDEELNLPSDNYSISQGLSYIEMPLEIEYALLNEKIGINLVGGFSSFFLSNNKIFSEADNGSKQFIGKASNINKVSYSANLGLGFCYQVFEKIDFNLEPMFKYQINTFNNASGDFKPYFIGVYSGFSIKF